MRIKKGLLMYVRPMLLGLVVIFGLLSIIASTQNQPKKNYVWVKPNGTDQDYRRDNYDCLKESQQRMSEYSRDGRYANSSSTVQTNDTLYSACMSARGWSLEEEIYAAKKVKAAKKEKKGKGSSEN